MFYNHRSNSTCIAFSDSRFLEKISRNFSNPLITIRIHISPTFEKPGVKVLTRQKIQKKLENFPKPYKNSQKFNKKSTKTKNSKMFQWYILWYKHYLIKNTAHITVNLEIFETCTKFSWFTVIFDQYFGHRRKSTISS